ncbi:MAG: endonuclease MutS2, partial [Gemmatimonadales bacterium]
PSHFLPDAGEALAALEFFPVLDVVAGHAAGPLGADRVRARRPSADPAWVREALAPVGEVLALMAEGDGVEAWDVPPIDAILPRLRLEGSVLEGAELWVLRRTLAAARSAAGELKRIQERAPKAAALRVPVPEAAIEKRLADAIGEDGEVLDGASPALARARREVHVAREKLVRKLETILQGLESGAAASGGSVTFRNGRYVIPVRRDSRARPDGIVHDESASAGTLFIEPGAAVELGNALRSAMADVEREVLRILRDLTARLRPHAGEIDTAHEMCVALDDLVARARHARACRAAVPAIRPPGGALVLRSARHPLLLARGVEAVPFDLEMPEGERTLLVGGPNTGGKTVLLKTVGLAAACAQAGIVPPVGEESALPVFTRIFADIGDHQSIAADLSTFSAHVATLRRVLEQADRESLVLIDEIGSGTDPAEGGALASASLRELNVRGTRTIATTHLGALKDLAASTPGVVNGSLEFDAERLEPTYRFRKGAPGRSYGLAIARRLGVAAGVLGAAEGMMSPGERSLDALLESAEARDRDLAELQQRLSESRLELDGVVARLELLEETLEQRERVLRAREKDADRRARAEARQLLLAARERVEAALRAADAARTEDEARCARRQLEDAIQAGAEEAPAEEPAPSPSAHQEVREGSRVRLETGAVGQVIELRDDGEAVVMAGSVRIVVPAGALVALPPGSESQGRRSWRSAEAPARRSTAPAGPAGDAPMDVDLRGMRGDEAEAVTIAALDAAVLADRPFIRIIHGMGTGALRDRVRELLRGDRRVAKFDFAPRNQGGMGVTIVEFAS